MKERNHSEDKGIVGWTILKEILEKKKLRGRYVLDLCGSGEGQMLDCCEHSSDSPNSMKCAS